ncbi:hypothetical protein HDU98_006214 [Podochytrium sp. JEL0797]|nr:hypothetical protein HDU98_006214 [Podochytrium sp. JEL0797]
MDLNQEGKAFSECFSKENVDLPIGYHFGVSAATSQFKHENHDLFSFEVYEVNPAIKKGKEENGGMPMNMEDLKKIQEVTSLVNQVEASDSETPKPDGFDNEFNAAAIRLLVSNQEKLINSLNVLSEKLGMAPISAARLVDFHYTRHAGIEFTKLEGKAGELEKRIALMMDKASAASKNVKILMESISQTFGSGDATMKTLTEALDKQNLQLDTTVQLAQTTPLNNNADGGVPAWVLYGAFFVVGGAVFYSIRSAMRGSSGKSRYD